MVSRMLLGVIAMVAVVAVGGIGFATYTSSITVNGSAASGDLNLAFYTSGVTDGTYAVCSVTSLTGTVATISASDLSPGDSCSVTLGVANYGSLPATSESSQLTSYSGQLCGPYGTYNCLGVADNLNGVSLNSEYNSGGSGNLGIPAGGGVLPGYYVVTIYEPSGTTQAVSISFSITFTGYVGS